LRSQRADRLTIPNARSIPPPWFNRGMWIDLHPGYWLLIVDWTIRLAALWWIPARSRPAAARSWLLLVGFVPLLGLPLYLVLGHPWVSRQRRERQARASQRIREEQRPLAALRAPEGAEGTAIAPLIERLGGFMPMRGNAVELLDDYDASIAQLIADIDGARHEAHLLYYLMFDDVVGIAVAEALLRACARGVRCRLLLDAVGAKPGLRAWSRRLRAGGVEVRAMLAGGLSWRRSARMDMRNHRKLAVIDGIIGYTGSQNLAAPDFVRGHPNRELVVRARGPVVAQLAALFASDWYLETGEVLAVSTPDIASQRNGDGMVAQVLPSGPAYPFENARDCVIALLRRARKRTVLVTPYFVPDDATLGALRVAALSGVEVVLMLSYTSNQRLAAWAQTSYFQELLDAGVRIARYRPRFLHAKHLSIDDDIALIGSINLDIRSFALNAEVGMLCYGREFVGRLRAIEAACLADSEPVDPDQWRRRPSWQRTRDGLARLADSLI
jgi:cardiolipin synthase